MAPEIKESGDTHILNSDNLLETGPQPRASPDQTLSGLQPTLTDPSQDYGPQAAMPQIPQISQGPGIEGLPRDLAQELVEVEPVTQAQLNPELPTNTRQPMSPQMPSADDLRQEIDLLRQLTPDQMKEYAVMTGIPETEHEGFIQSLERLKSLEPEQIEQMANSMHEQAMPRQQSLDMSRLSPDLQQRMQAAAEEQLKDAKPGEQMVYIDRFDPELRAEIEAATVEQMQEDYSAQPTITTPPQPTINTPPQPRVNTPAQPVVRPPEGPQTPETHVPDGQEATAPYDQTPAAQPMAPPSRSAAQAPPHSRSPAPVQRPPRPTTPRPAPQLRIKEEIVQKVADDNEIELEDAYIMLASKNAEANPAIAQALAAGALDALADRLEKPMTVEERLRPIGYQEQLGDIYAKSGDHETAMELYQADAARRDCNRSRIKYGRELIEAGREQEGFDSIIKVLKDMRRGESGAFIGLESLTENLPETAPEQEFLKTREVADYSSTYRQLTDEIRDVRWELKKAMEKTWFKAISGMPHTDFDVQGWDASRKVLVGAVYSFLKHVQPTGYDYSVKGLDDSELHTAAEHLVDNVNLKHGQMAARFEAHEGFDLVLGFLHYMKSRCEGQLKSRTVESYALFAPKDSKDEHRFCERDAFAREYCLDHKLDPTEDRIEVISDNLTDRLWEIR